MKRKTAMMVATVAAIGTLAVAEAGAAGGRGGGRMNRGAQGGGTCTQSQTQTQSTAASQTRPAGSQRRDGTFLTTGVTANGSTVRPGYGQGVQDGTGPVAPTTTTPQ